MLSRLLRMSWQNPAHCSAKGVGSELLSLAMDVASREWMAVFMELMAFTEVTCCNSLLTPL
jgi:hypothetical protein